MDLGAPRVAVVAIAVYDDHVPEIGQYFSRRTIDYLRGDQGYRVRKLDDSPDVVYEHRDRLFSVYDAEVVKGACDKLEQKINDTKKACESWTNQQTEVLALRLPETVKALLPELISDEFKRQLSALEAQVNALRQELQELKDRI
jgi:hypothetical protein